MLIAVLVKRVPDTASVFKVTPDNKSIDTANLKYVMSPYDEYAVEEAIKIKEASGADEVVIVSAGPDGTKDTIRQALAMGADRAVLVKEDDLAGVGPRGIAQILAAALKDLSPSLVFAGKQAVDDDASQVPERVAELLELPHASVVSKLEMGDGKATATREVEGGNIVVELPLPALLSIEKGINSPRYPTLPNIMKAKKKEIKELSLSDLGLSKDELKSKFEVQEMSLPRQDRLNKILEGDTSARVSQLVSALREEEKVL
jgi:electron transfer flavoprotein beta subunit